MLQLPSIRVGEPLCHEGLSLFPLFPETDGGSQIAYVLAEEALGTGATTVREIDEHGSVPELEVDNAGDQPVLFLEGDDLRGAKQNRVLNTSVLVAAGSRLKLPVSCVEAGRWHDVSDAFQYGAMHASPQLRSVLRTSTSRSLRTTGRPTSDQNAVWDYVADQMTRHGSRSKTAAMSDTYESRADRLSAYRENLPYVDGAGGYVAAVGGRVRVLDWFDRPDTLRRAWDRLLSGVVMEALEVDEEGGVPAVSRDDVDRLWRRVQEGHWEEVPGVGEGREMRWYAADGTVGSALVYCDAVLHCSVVGALPED